ERGHAVPWHPDGSRSHAPRRHISPCRGSPPVVVVDLRELLGRGLRDGEGHHDRLHAFHAGRESTRPALAERDRAVRLPGHPERDHHQWWSRVTERGERQARSASPLYTFNRTSPIPSSVVERPGRASLPLSSFRDAAPPLLVIPFWV